MVRFARSLAVLTALCATTSAFAALPAATTEPATSITATSVVLNGTATPNGETTTGWFRLSTTDPGTCNDTFGTRVPGTGGTGVGNGSTAQSYTITTGVLPGNTYFYCAVVNNNSGTVFGIVRTFTTPATAPIVTATTANPVTSNSATLEGTVDARGSSGTAWFRYHTSQPSSCNDSFGTRVPTTGGFAISGNGTVPFTQNITGLLPGVTYYYCAIAQNGVGMSFGPVSPLLQFTTLVAAPSVTTNTVTNNVYGTQAELNGSVAGNGAPTTAWFRIASSDPGGCNDAFGTRVPASSGVFIGSSSSPQAYSQTATSLLPGTTYWYCAIANNSEGSRFGSVTSFTTPAAPTVTTVAASSITSTNARMNGSVTANGTNAIAYFRYSATNREPRGRL